MMKKASLSGLTFRNDVELDGDEFKAPISDSYKEFLRGNYARVVKRHYRPIGEAPRDKADGKHTNVNETIDSSVFNRWRADLNYRPPNLDAWAKSRGVDPSNLQGTVRADDPSVAVAD
jgi:hypothetical protein